MKIYQQYYSTLFLVMRDFRQQLIELSKEQEKATHRKLFEHLTSRVKSSTSMEEKCLRKGIPATLYSALKINKDSIGIRLVVDYIDDIYNCINAIKNLDNCKIVQEKDYVTHSKKNGYRSYHLILSVTTNYQDLDGNEHGHYYIEVQIRTLAMDAWASLEHELKYKHQIKNAEVIQRELKKCADDLAACDIQMKTIKELIDKEK